MTTQKHEKENIIPFFKSAAVLIFFFIISFFMSDEISEYAYDGFLLSLNVIIPTAFPFMLLSDFSQQVIEFDKSRLIGNFFEYTFKINRIGISALISGILGGFPIGAKNAISLYNDGKISKCECERLVSFSNIPSAAYVISAIGIGMLNSLKLGMILYFSVLISAIITGYILGIKRSFSHNYRIIKKQKYDFVNSVKNAATSSLYITFFISAFSVMCGLILKYSKFKLLCAHILPLLEVANACSFFSDLCIIDLKSKLIFISFSLSFSGLSVIMQSLSFIDQRKISFLKCLIYKLIQAVICSLILLILPL